MRRYYIATRILLILSAIDFKLALAAPVLMQEKLQTRVDVPSISKSVTTGLGKRLGGELEKLGEVYFKTSGKSIDSSGIHPSPSSAPSGPDHGSTNVMQPASSTTDLDSSLGQSCSPSGLSARGGVLGKNCLDLLEQMGAHDPSMHGPGPMVNYGAYQKLPDEPPPPQWIPLRMVERPPVSHNADPNSGWESWTDAELQSSTPARPPIDVGQSSGHGPGPPPKDTDPVNTGPPGTDFYSFTWVGEGSPTEPDLSSITESQPAALNPATYGVKGKAKELRRSTSGTRDVGNTAKGGHRGVTAR